jgi:VIT1/CCC1 family predicted Fe2+/Mn2+ transporter
MVFEFIRQGRPFGRFVLMLLVPVILLPLVERFRCPVWSVVKAVSVLMLATATLGPIMTERVGRKVLRTPSSESD